MDFDLEDLVHVEQSFYDAGYTDGAAHGRIHGLIEGRALGREKGFEFGEEIGFYAGVAQMWTAVYAKQGKRDHRAIHHATQLIALVAAFPRTNPHPDAGTDISALLRQIRSRYKTMCAALGVRASLRAADGEGYDEETRVSGASSKNVRKSVWRVEGAPGGEQGMSF
ncbi:DUF1715-domain-containing protein [Amylostereum chailletii]|nr:DUF1715-domain-containing protein [Amylostereum chailletii]